MIERKCDTCKIGYLSSLAEELIKLLKIKNKMSAAAAVLVSLASLASQCFNSAGKAGPCGPGYEQCAPAPFPAAFKPQ